MCFDDSCVKLTRNLIVVWEWHGCVEGETSGGDPSRCGTDGNCSPIRFHGINEHSMEGDWISYALLPVIRRLRILYYHTNSCGSDSLILLRLSWCSMVSTWSLGFRMFTDRCLICWVFDFSIDWLLGWLIDSFIHWLVFLYLWSSWRIGLTHLWIFRIVIGWHPFYLCLYQWLVLFLAGAPAHSQILSSSNQTKVFGIPDSFGKAA